MNISRNLLSLGLIAIISGISTAQTYTATAGTNGVTDIQSDYSMSTGDGASVSVDVPLEFELPKKVAIAVEAADRTLPNSDLFSGTSSYHTTKLVSAISLTPRTQDPGLSVSFVRITGVVYANTAVSVTFDLQDFIHETDPNSEIKVQKRVGLGKANVTSWGEAALYGNANTSTLDSSLSMQDFPATFNVDETALAIEGNKLRYITYGFPYLDTIDPTDRAGKYLSTATITVSTL